MNIGQIISGLGHAGFILFALFGGVFQSDPIPFEVTQVTAISNEEFEAIMAAERPPETVSSVAMPEAPEADAATPDMSSQTDADTTTTQPDPAEAADPDSAPQETQTTPPAEADVAEEPPELMSPSEDTAVLLPDTSQRPKPRPSKRVAPEQVAPPDPDTAIDDVAREEVVPDEEAETVQEEAEATAPEEAATEIVTEAEEAAAAPVSSVRPKARPASPPQQEVAEPAPATQPEPDAESAPSAVEDALAAALGQTSDTTSETRPIGQPMTRGEKDALRVAVQKCWNVGSLSTEALGTTVVVAVDMSEDGTPVTGSIRMIDASGGGTTAARQAYEAARRAIIRCGNSGFDLPVEKYDHWKTIEMTFNPENMRIK
ncbi:energy transducer TonB [Roseovarius sp. E0-M6]|uniref:energy transducer TonB n=1 Tax=Roseovarius sp. E0-M6 TaxID=3127118 RepID=UPI0030104416